MLSVFVTGLERQTGKTIVTSGLASAMQGFGYATGVYKPIQTNATILNGFKASPDLLTIKKFDSNILTESTYMLTGSSSPFVASYEDNLKIDKDAIFNDYQRFIKSVDCVIVEGSNSIWTPVLSHHTELDIINMLGIPSIVVVNPKVTSIDAIIAGLEGINKSSCRILGIVINQYDENSENLEEKYFPQIIKEFSNFNLLGVLPYYNDISSINAGMLISEVLTSIKIEEIFGVQIAKLSSY